MSDDTVQTTATQRLERLLAMPEIATWGGVHVSPDLARDVLLEHGIDPTEADAGMSVAEIKKHMRGEGGRMSKTAVQIKQEIEQEHGVTISVADGDVADYRRLTREMWEIEQEFGGPIAWERMVRNRMVSDRRIVARWLAECALGLACLELLLALASAGLGGPLEYGVFVLSWFISVDTATRADKDGKVVWRIIQAKMGWGV